MKINRMIIIVLTIFIFLLVSCVKYDVSDIPVFKGWKSIKAPKAPEIKKINLNEKTSALLILDLENKNCDKKKRPRCVDNLPKVKAFLDKARAKNMLVIYSITNSSNEKDIVEEIKPFANETVIKSSVDKFYNTDLENLLKNNKIKTVVIVGTSAEGAVLHTAAGASMRGINVVIPVDGIASSELYGEQYTIWHMVNSPGTRKHTSLSRFSLIDF